MILFVLLNSPFYSYYNRKNCPGSAAVTALAKEVAAMQDWQEQTQMRLDDSEAVASASHKMLTAAMALIEAQNR